VFEIKNGYAWVQSLRDDYVGYTPASSLQLKKIIPTHKVIALRCIIYKSPDIKSLSLTELSFNSLIEVTGKVTNKFFYKIKNLGWCHKNDLVQLNAKGLDIVEQRNICTHHIYGVDAAQLELTVLV
jgi:hypothetical protein